MKKAKKIVAALLLTSSFALGLSLIEVGNTPKDVSSVFAHDPGGGGH